MITCILMGGLGNQLFQIFTLIAHSINTNQKFILPEKLPVYDKRHTYWNSLLINLQEYISNTGSLKWIQYNEPNFHYNKLPLLDDNLILNGYFQSYKYFETNYKEICDKLGLYQMRNTIKQKYFTRMDNTISLHFRMGDYKNMPNHHPLISDNYYINSLHHIVRVTKQEHWNVLYTCEETDDEIVLSRIRNIKNIFKELKFIKIDNSLKDYEQMLLMSVCDHNIIANSSFSWWSAYINDNIHKIVCYPSMWFGIANSNLNIKDLHLNSWNKISV